MPRVRIMGEAAKYIRGSDPAPPRCLLTTGVLPCVRIGAKYLLDLDVLEAFLSGDLRRGTA